MSDREEPRSSMWDLAGSAGRAGTMWPVLADIHQVSLAAQMGCQMQLDSPRSIRPPRVTVGATGVTGVPDLNAFGLPPLHSAVDLCTTQSVQVALHQAGLHQQQAAGLGLPPLQSVHAALLQAEVLQQAGLQQEVQARLQGGLQVGVPVQPAVGIQQAVAIYSPEAGRDTNSGTISQQQLSVGVGGMGGGFGGMGGDGTALGASPSRLKDADMELDESEESYEGQQNYEVCSPPQHTHTHTPHHTIHHTHLTTPYTLYTPHPTPTHLTTLTAPPPPPPTTGRGTVHRQAGVDGRGGCGPAAARAGAWAAALVSDRKGAAGQGGQAVQRAVAQPRVPLREQGGVDGRGGPAHHGAGAADGHQVVQGRHDDPRPHGQRHQEPVELDYASHPAAAAQGRGK